MADALSKFISGLQTLDPANLNAPANQAALQKFQSLPSAEQRGVLNGLAGKHGVTFEQLDALSPADKARVTENVKAGKPTFDGIERQPALAQSEAKPAQSSAKPATFEQRWADASEKHRQNPPPPVDPDTAYAQRHGAEAARVRNGYRSPERDAQLARIASIQSEAKATGKTFSEVADAFAAAGK